MLSFRTITVILALVIGVGCTLETDSTLNVRLGLLLGPQGGSSSSDGDGASVTNAVNNGVIRSGALVGTLPSPENRVTVSIDGGEYTSAVTDGANWSFTLPFGSATWRLNSTHNLSIRTLDATGNQLNEINLVVRKGVNQDINGDGIADIAAGAPLHSSNRGRAFLFNGDINNITSGSATSSSFLVTGLNTSEEFGKYIAMGDLNGDGYGDIIIGAPAFSTSTGNVYIFHGSANGAATTPTRVIAGEATSSFFGSAITAADINGGGSDELVVGAFGASGNGRVYVFNGGASGVTQNLASSANRIITGESSGDNFGFSLAAGDVNGDGHADIAAGGRNYNAGQGRVYIFHGSPTGIAPTLAGSANTLMTGAGASGGLGGGLELADMNADGFSDLISGSPNQAGMTGALYIHHGSGGGIATNTVNFAPNTTMTGESAGVNFGLVLRAGDLNGDGYPELIASAHTYASSTGRAYVFTGSSAGITATNPISAQTIITGDNTGIEFSAAISAADWNGDGITDLALSARKHNSNMGRVHFFYGSTGGISGPLSSAQTTLDGETTATQFGAGLR